MVQFRVDGCGEPFKLSIDHGFAQAGAPHFDEQLGLDAPDHVAGRSAAAASLPQGFDCGPDFPCAAFGWERKEEADVLRLHLLIHPYSSLSPVGARSNGSTDETSRLVLEN